MTSQFDKIVDRRNTSSTKWDYCLQASGKADILPMWVADMDFMSPAPITEAIVKRAEHGIFGYTEIPDELIKAWTIWIKKRFNWEIKERSLLISPGVVTSVNTAVLAFTEIGDKVLMQTPIYTPFYSSIRDNGRELITSSLVNNNGRYEIDFLDLESKLATGVKMMLLCSPHNPIGRVWRMNELQEIIRLCKKYNVILVSDEIHSDLVYSGFTHIPIASLTQEVKTVTLVSPTKTFNIAGLSLSGAIITDEELRRKFIDIMHHTGAGILNVFGLVAAEAAYTRCGLWLDELLIYLEENLNVLVEYFEKYIPSIKVIRPEATYLAWLDCRDLPVNLDKLNEFFADKAGVWLNDGITFGKEGYGFVRINFACPRAVLLEGLSRIKKAVESLKM